LFFGGGPRYLCSHLSKKLAVEEGNSKLGLRVSNSTDQICNVKEQSSIKCEMVS
jgi:hypothetical protein